MTETHIEFTAQYRNHEYLMDPVIAIKWMWMCCWHVPVAVTSTGTSHKQHACKPEDRNHPPDAEKIYAVMTGNHICLLLCQSEV